MQIIQFEDLPNTTTAIDSEHLIAMQNNIKSELEDKKGIIILKDIASAAPEECQKDDVYYNVDTALIYRAIGTDTWNTIGEQPSYNYLYLNKKNKSIYYYNGTELENYGGAAIDNLESSSSINPPSINAVNEAISGINDRIDQISDSVDTLQYNLVKNGPAVKTGRKVDGYDEYIKYITYANISPNGADTYIQLGLPDNVVHTSMEIWAGNGTFMVPNMWHYNDTNYFRCYKSGNSMVDANLGAGADWFRSGMKVHIIVKYFQPN